MPVIAALKNQADREPLLTPRELLSHFKIHPDTLRRWRKEGMPHVRLSPQTVRYDLLAVRDWLQARNESNSGGADE